VPAQRMKYIESILRMSGIPASSSSRLSEVSRIQSFACGQTVQHAGEVPTYWAYVVDGALALHFSGPLHKQIVLSYGQGEWIGEASIIRNEKNSCALIGLMDSDILLVPSAFVLQELSTSQEFVSSLLKMVARGVIDQSSKVLSLKLLDTRARLYCSIVLQINTFIMRMLPMSDIELQSGIEIPLSRTEFADIIRVSRGLLWKELALFRDQKLIELGYKRILVLNVLRWKKLFREMHSATSEKEIAELREGEFSFALDCTVKCRWSMHID
jgi:CRP-like cAMP-binding protein